MVELERATTRHVPGNIVDRLGPIELRD